MPARTKRMPQFTHDPSPPETPRDLIGKVCDRKNDAGRLLGAPEPIRIADKLRGLNRMPASRVQQTAMRWNCEAAARGAYGAVGSLS